MGRLLQLDRSRPRCNKRFTVLTVLLAAVYVGTVVQLSSMRGKSAESTTESSDGVGRGGGDDSDMKRRIVGRVNADAVSAGGASVLEPFEPGCDVHPPLIGSPRAFRLNSTRGGRRDLGSSSLAIIGIARNIGRGKIESARRGFQSLGNSVFGGSYQVFFLENDSNDCTGTVLKEWERDDPERVHVSSEQLNNAAPKVGDHNRRIKMISLYRNRVLRMMKSHTGWPFDYVLAVDLDMSPWEPESLASAFSEPQPWDMVCANGVMSAHDPRYYDAFAFRSAQFPHGPLEERSYFGLKGYVSQIHNGLVRHIGDEPVAVQSCFGGMAIYRGELFEGCEYSSNDGDCEHVHLHRCMALNHPKAGFYMLPSMRLVYDLDQGEIDGYKVRTS